jgi:hypothetical protein
MTPAGAVCFHPLCRRHLKRGQEFFAKAFAKSLYMQGLIAVLRQGPATPEPTKLAQGARQCPLSLTHTVDALLPALVEQVVAASGPPDARNGARPAMMGS